MCSPARREGLFTARCLFLCGTAQVGNLPDDFFTSAEIAAAGGLVENIPLQRRRDEFFRAMQRALCSVDLISQMWAARALTAVA